MFRMPPLASIFVFSFLFLFYFMSVSVPVKVCVRYFFNQIFIFSLPFHTFQIQKDKWKWNNL